MIEIKFNGTDRKLIEQLRTRPQSIMEALRVKMNALMIRLQSKIVTEKLSGQVLKHRTGKLAASIRALPAEVQGSIVTGRVEGGGGPAFYGRIHEFGGVFQVKGRLVTEVFGRKVKNPKESRPYSVTFPERSFMRTSLEESREAIFEALTTTVKEEIGK